MSSTQLAVIGGGPGGYTAAFMAADLGMQVTLIDPQSDPGGVCLHCGCIPSKVLLHVARVLTEAQEATLFGVEFSQPRIDLDKVRSWKEEVIQKMTGGLKRLCKSRNVEFVQGRASLLNSRRLRVQEIDGKEREISFENAILATGSRPAKLPGLLPRTPRVMNSTDALALQDIPESLLIIGGGYIGLELGTIYSALGSRVIIAEMMSGLLPGVDRDLVTVLSRRLKQRFHDIMLGTKIISMEETRDGIRVQFEGENIQQTELLVGKVLVAVGRAPNSGHLGLENTRVELDEHGFVKIDERCQTTEPGIYAIGDVAGQPMLAHKASHEGRVAAEAIAGHEVAFEPQAIPAVVFTDPELAWCGLTEMKAKEENRTVKVVRFPWGASGRATTLARGDGITKLILDPETERVLGAGIVGVGAGELIAECVLAIEMAAAASDIERSIHPHPTLSETIMESAAVFFDRSTHLYRRRRR